MNRNILTPDFDFDRTLHEQGSHFAQVLSQVLERVFGAGPSLVAIGALEKRLNLRAEHIVTIPFVGMVTGEFILAFRGPDARAAFPEAKAETVGHEVLTECLNMAAGACLSKLTQIFQKTTITTPRVLQGSIDYPSVKHVPITLRGKDWSAQAYFYVDRMRLDIAESYRGAIDQLQTANKELLQANNRLKEQQSQLVHSEKMASLGVMAAGVAHEINNPLAFVLSNSEVLGTYVSAMSKLISGYEQLSQFLTDGYAERARYESERLAEFKRTEDIGFILGDTRKLLEESQFGLERIRGIVNGLKRFSRASAPENKRVQLNEELANTLLLLHNELKFRCEVVTDFQARQEIDCDPSEMSQVFLNLILNAAQAMPTGHSGKIRISTEDTDTGIRVKVADNGVGIASENLSKIFSPFFTTKPVGEGTGLGLSISHGIIEKHGGRISVESALGQGTTFTVELPRSRS